MDDEKLIEQIADIAGRQAGIQLMLLTLLNKNGEPTMKWIQALQGIENEVSALHEAALRAHVGLPPREKPSSDSLFDQIDWDKISQN